MRLLSRLPPSFAAGNAAWGSLGIGRIDTLEEAAAHNVRTDTLLEVPGEWSVCCSGGFHTVLLNRQTGKVGTAGKNESGQLGQGTTGATHTFKPVPTFTRLRLKLAVDMGPEMRRKRVLKALKKQKRYKTNDGGDVVTDSSASSSEDEKTKFDHALQNELYQLKGHYHIINEKEVEAQRQADVEREQHGFWRSLYGVKTKKQAANLLLKADAAEQEAHGAPQGTAGRYKQFRHGRRGSEVGLSTVDLGHGHGLDEISEARVRKERAAARAAVDSRQPQLVRELVPMPAIALVACGGAHSLLVTEDRHRVLGCGSNSSGQLGLGEGYEEGSILTFREVFFAEEIACIAAGWLHSVVVHVICDPPRAPPFCCHPGGGAPLLTIAVCGSPSLAGANPSATSTSTSTT